MVSERLLEIPTSSDSHPPPVASHGQQPGGDIARGLTGLERAHADAIMRNPDIGYGGGIANAPLVWTDVNNLFSSRTSTSMPSSMDAAGSPLTSMSHNPQEGDMICRCKMHSDACDRSQFAHGAEKCITCLGYFSWTTNAQSCLVRATENDILCCCKWHDRACRRLQDDYDARKCDCCKGWLAFSEQASKLIRPPASNETAGPVEDQVDFSEFLDFG